MRIMRLVAAACFVAACVRPQSPPPAAPPPPLEVKTFAPLGVKADAKSPRQAAILGTDAKDGSTILPLPLATSTVSVDAMVAGSGPDVASGLTTMKLTAGPDIDGSVAVGGVDGSAGVWVAAFVAATALDKDLTDFTFSASADGSVDGASGLVAAGFLAAITGATVDPTATMAGMINPDGTVGPVDGIPEAFLAAIAKGKRRLGYPIGARYAKSKKTGELVDLEKLARDHNVRAVEIADVHDAYTLLTGQKLPRAVPVPAEDMALDAAAATAVNARYKIWQQKLAAEWGALLQLESAGSLPPTLVQVRDIAKRSGEEAESLRTRGMHGAAYARIYAAYQYAQTANQTYAVLARVQDGKIDDAVAILARHDKLGELTTAVLAKIAAMRPSTLGAHLQMMAAFRAGLRGWTFQTFASSAVDVAKQRIASLKGAPSAQLGSDETARAVIETVLPTLFYVGKTVAETTLATEQLELQASADVAYTCSVSDVRRLATSFQSAGAAGLTYVDALLVLPFAERAKVDPDEARRRIAMNEPDYLVALTGSRLSALDPLKQQWGESSLSWGLLTLAGSQLAYYESSELIARYASLGVDVSEDGSGRVEAIEHERAFASVLATAERTARASARAARVATGSIPLQAKLAYQNALVDRDGTPRDKLDALAQFWASSAYSQTAIMLARN